MAKTVFCSNCANQLNYDQIKCTCGFEMTLAKRNEISTKFNNIDNHILIDDNLKDEALTCNEVLLKDYKLSKVYLSGGSAKRDYEDKVDFLKSYLLPSINNWRKALEKAENQVAKDKVEVYGRILGITDFVLKEFFGPFVVKENGLEVFEEFRDFGKYKLKETMFDAELDFSDIKDVSFGTIGNNIMSSVGNTLTEGSFKEISKKTEWSKSDYNTVKAEVGVAVAAELISGVSKMIGQNTAAIKNVREADYALNTKLESISNVINALLIEEHEIEKQKRLYDKSDIILDTCFNKTLKPIVDELNNDPTYKAYRQVRKPFDYAQEIIKIEKEALDTEIKVSFWGSLLKSKQKNYVSNFQKRMQKIGKQDKYQSLLDSLKVKPNNSLVGVREFEKVKINEFKEFEKINRRTLKTIPAISNNVKDVLKFAGVLKQVKSNIIN